MVEKNNNQNLPSSFRDPNGSLFLKDGSIYRQVNLIYKENYNHLMSSGLYDALIDKELLIPHADTNLQLKDNKTIYKIIKPEVVPFISYPYEWCFSQLKHAALLTLEIQKIALGFGMTLKDSSAYNIQFLKGKPILIDTLSFEKYKEGEPWVAYRQFCQHFLAPLMLMSYRDIRLNQLFRIYMDGIPLDLADALLPLRGHLKFSLFSHIHFHAKLERHYKKRLRKAHYNNFSRFDFFALLDNLESAVRSLKLKSCSSEWADYYEDVNYSREALEFKKNVVAEFVDQVNPKTVFDFGANTGLFSRIASNKNIQAVSFDIDIISVEENYIQCLKNKEINLLPLFFDLTNPSPGIGWENEERMSFLKRGFADMAFCLALIHHLAISDNVPFEKIASFFSKVCDWLIIEFMPKTDSQTQLLLERKDRAFQNYTEEIFKMEFEQYFIIQNSIKIKDSERVLYLLKRK